MRAGCIQRFDLFRVYNYNGELLQDGRWTNELRVVPCQWLYIGRLHLGCNPGSRQQTDQHHPDISRQDTFDISGTRLVKNTAFDAFYKNDMLIHNTDPIWGIYHFRPFLLRSVQGGIASTNENQTGRKQNSLSLKPVSPTPVA